jgi:hypothetical protein
VRPRSVSASAFAISSGWCGRLCEEPREPLLSLLRGKYAGFGPTFAVEKLAEHEGIAVSKEAICQLQIAHRLWRPKKRREKRVYSLRERRPRFGELIQIDRSPHAWLDDRGPRCSLMASLMTRRVG